MHCFISRTLPLSCRVLSCQVDLERKTWSESLRRKERKPKTWISFSCARYNTDEVYNQPQWLFEVSRHICAIRWKEYCFEAYILWCLTPDGHNGPDGDKVFFLWFFRLSSGSICIGYKRKTGVRHAASGPQRSLAASLSSQRLGHLLELNSTLLLLICQLHIHDPNHNSTTSQRCSSGVTYVDCGGEFSTVNSVACLWHGCWKHHGTVWAYIDDLTWPATIVR